MGRMTASIFARRAISGGAAVFAAFALLACSPQTADMKQGEQVAAGEGFHPESGLAIIPVTVSQGDATYTFKTEFADSAEAQTRGMMFRTEMAPDEGMLFPSETARPRSFWMRNTLIPLDLIFVGADNRVVNIAANAQPYSEDQIPSDGPVIAVLEIPGGRAAELGIEAGATVEW